MVVLKAIGRFFARIGRWIRDTAWVQPLLIVGGIFGIIFSIPYLTNWVKSWFNNTTNASNEFYKKNALSWKDVDGGNSEVDVFFKYLINYDNERSQNTKTYKKYGDKFFLNFVKTDCSVCESNYYGFKTLKEEVNKNSYFTNVDANGEKIVEEIKYFNIFIDETNDDGEMYFTKYVSGASLDDSRYWEIFEAASSTDYWYKLSNTADTGLQSSFKGLFDTEITFNAPTTFLIDFTKDAPDYNGDASQYGISEILFTVPTHKDLGTENGGKAKSIWDCWNHQGIFSEKEND